MSNSWLGKKTFEGKWSSLDCPFDDCGFPMLSYKCKVHYRWSEVPEETQQEIMRDLPGWIGVESTGYAGG